LNSYYHSVIHAKKYGGIPDDYQAIDDFIDSSKATMADMRHRALLHSSFGIYICEKVFGNTITNSEGKEVPVRLIAEEHILQDLGFIPTVEHYLGLMPLKRWMGGSVKKSKTIPPSKKKTPEETSDEDEATRYRMKLRESNGS
jgi:hypothetical protein